MSTNKRAVLSSDATMDSRFSGAHSIIMQGIRSTMTVPLLHRDELLGIMHLDSLFTSNAFTEKDLQICTGMAAQAAISIQNARLASRIEKEAQTRAQISRLIPPIPTTGIPTRCAASRSRATPAGAAPGCDGLAKRVPTIT